MSLKCVVELDIPQAIHNNEKPITISELVSSTLVPPVKALQMGRLMRLLANSGIFAQSNNNDDETTYSLNPVSSLLVENINSNLSQFVLAMLHPVMVDPFQSMSQLFRSSNNEPTPFSYVHGFDGLEMMRQNPNFNKVFNEGMISDTKLVMGLLIEECGHIFEGVGSLVDVGEGTGFAAMAISKAFPHMKCTVVDLSQVMNDVKKNGEDKGEVDFICGDMFKYIPPADAVLLKWIPNGRSDDNCVKILKRCKESIKEDGCKVIIIDIAIDSKNSYERLRDAQLYFDMLMMVECEGVERSEQEWKKIFIDVGFRNYKITPALSPRSVIEVYP